MLSFNLLSKVLSNISSPVDVLQASAYYMLYATGGIGSFISTTTLDYMDVAVGSMRDKRTARRKGGISVADIYMVFGQDTSRIKGGYISDNIFIYKTTQNWFIGIDNPSITSMEIKKLIDEVTLLAYPVYKHLTSVEDNNPDRDFLTSLYNQKKFKEDMTVVLKTLTVKKFNVHLFLMAFYNLGLVNRMFGYSVGNEVLRSATMQVKSLLMGYGPIYRLSGNTYAAVALDITGEQAVRLAKRIEDMVFQAPGGVPVGVIVVHSRVDEQMSALQDDRNIPGVIDEILNNTERLFQTKREDQGNVVKKGNITPGTALTSDATKSEGMEDQHAEPGSTGSI